MSVALTPVLAVAAVAGLIGGWLGGSKLSTLLVSLSGVVLAALGLTVGAALAFEAKVYLTFVGGGLIMTGLTAGAMILPDPDISPGWRALGGGAAALATAGFFAVAIGANP